MSTAPIRPRWARIVAALMLAIVLGGTVWLIRSMVKNGSDQPYYTVSILTLTIAASTFLIMHLLVVARPSPSGLYIRNLVGRRHIAWEEIVSVRFSADRPWAQLDVVFGEPINVMAIQSADGDYARKNAQRLAQWVRTAEAEEP